MKRTETSSEARQRCKCTWWMTPLYSTTVLIYQKPYWSRNVFLALSGTVVKITYFPLQTIANDQKGHVICIPFYLCILNLDQTPSRKAYQFREGS